MPGNDGPCCGESRPGQRHWRGSPMSGDDGGRSEVMVQGCKRPACQDDSLSPNSSVFPPDLCNVVSCCCGNDLLI